MTWVHEGSVSDLLVNVFILVEGKRAAQADIQDHPYSPHVQGAVIAMAADHLGGKIRRRTHHRAPERLLTDDPRKTKVTQFHLKHRQCGYVSACTANVWGLFKCRY